MYSAAVKAKASATKTWFSSIDPGKVLQTIMSGEHLAFIVEDTYLILADLHSPWFANDEHKVLAEMLVLKINQAGPGKFQDIPRALTALAGVVGARAVVVGTALAPTNRALARMYSREGFQASATELYKEL